MMMMMNAEALYDYSDEATATTNATSQSNGDDSTTPTSQRTSRSSTSSANSTSTGTICTSSGTSTNNNNHSIALFGGTGKVGKEFLHVALDAGYRVRMLTTESESDAPTSLETNSQASSSSSSTLLHVVVGSLNDPDSIRSVIRHADFVVCMLNDTLPNKNYPENYVTSFVKLLYPLMREEPSIQLFLFQSMSLATDMNGKTPILSRMVKTVVHSAGRSLQLQDQDAAIQMIAQEHQRSTSSSRGSSDKENHPQPPQFSYLVTRPTVLIKEGAASKKLCASKSQPGLFPITCADLAEFTLNALLNTKLYNSCPYVVSDSGL